MDSQTSSNQIKSSKQNNLSSHGTQKMHSPESLEHHSSNLHPTEQNPMVKPVYGFYDDETDTFLFCQSYDEYASFMAKLPPENQTTFSSEDIDEDLWQPLLEVFNDSRFSEPIPDPRLEQILD